MNDLKFPTTVNINHKLIYTKKCVKICRAHVCTVTYPLFSGEGVIKKFFLYVIKNEKLSIFSAFEHF